MKKRTKLERRDKARVPTIYADTFFHLREQMALKTVDFKDKVSAGSLSRFENYETLLDIGTMKELMLQMHSSLGEYERFCDNFKRNPFEAGYQRIARARYLGDKEDLQHIYDLMCDYGKAYRRGALAAKASLGGLNETEVKESFNHLFGVDMWTINEIYFAGFVVEELPQELVKSLLSDIFERDFLEIYKGSSKYTREIYNFASRAALMLIKQGERLETLKLLEQMKGHLSWETELFTRNDLKFVEGLWLCQFGNRAEGQKLVGSALNVLELLDCQVLKKFYIRRFEEILAEKFSQEML